MSTKRITTLLAILALTLSVVACSDDDEKNPIDAGPDCACADFTMLDTQPDTQPDTTTSDTLPDQATADTKPDGMQGCVPACSNSEVCVQLFDGTCQTTGPKCVAVSTACQTGQCTTACEKELCGSNYQCQNQVPCGTEQGAALNCYGI
jgi:hypothetical protein